MTPVRTIGNAVFILTLSLGALATPNINENSATSKSLSCWDHIIGDLGINLRLKVLLLKCLNGTGHLLHWSAPSFLGQLVCAFPWAVKATF